MITFTTAMITTIFTSHYYLAFPLTPHPSTHLSKVTELGLQDGDSLMLCKEPENPFSFSGTPTAATIPKTVSALVAEGLSGNSSGEQHAPAEAIAKNDQFQVPFAPFLR